tara:strand:+ start:16992 stop:17306 length:315 start_codon:yes stop_codon:yes gene_type:complete
MERTTLPNSTTSLVLGILSIPTCICYGVIGLILGIIAIILGRKADKLDKNEPGLYTGAGNAKAGVVTGIIGVVLSLAYISFVVWLLTTYGWDGLQEKLLELQNR